MSQPRIEGIRRILVVGAGAMGSQIGMVCSLAGYDVTINDIDQNMLAKAKAQLCTRMDRNVETGRMTRDAVDAALARMSFTTDLEEAAAAADFVIEAAVEKLEVKRQLFARLDEVAPQH